MAELLPTGITVNRKAEQVTVTWNDGHASIYSFSLLRHACPCAECRGGHANMSDHPDEAVFSMPDEDIPATHLRNLEAVGSYAMTIEWEDGHRYGIYNWRFLRELCPCPLCRKRFSHG